MLFFTSDVVKGKNRRGIAPLVNIKSIFTHLSFSFLQAAKLIYGDDCTDGSFTIVVKYGLSQGRYKNE